MGAVSLGELKGERRTRAPKLDGCLGAATSLAVLH